MAVSATLMRACPFRSGLLAVSPRARGVKPIRVFARLTLASLLAVTAACGSGGGSDTTGLIKEDNMELRSVFEEEGPIPVEYTCDGDDVSPPLTIAGLPSEARTMAVIMDDPDAPAGTFDHWIAFDIPLTEEIPRDVGDLGTSGRNSAGDLGYKGPCPPGGTHRYIFRVYALDTELRLGEGASKREVLEAAEDHVVGQGTLVGTYSR